MLKAIWSEHQFSQFSGQVCSLLLFSVKLSHCRLFPIFATAVKKIRSWVLKLLPIRLRFALKYMLVHRRFSLLIRPQLFNEKLMLRLALDRRPLLITLSDKVLCRQYVANKIGGQHLSELLWVGESAEDLPWDSLPDRFVIKANHGSGFVKLVNNRLDINRDDLVKEVNGWLEKDYGIDSWEWAYTQIKPRQLMLEAWVDADSQDKLGVPWDYRFFIFAGKCAMVQVDTDRALKESKSSFRFTADWQFMPDISIYPAGITTPTRPDRWEEMLALAEAVGKELDFVRVDLYDGTPHLIIGEMTMFPEAGTEKFRDPNHERWLGQFWQLELG